jgi:hypothetical protein
MMKTLKFGIEIETTGRSRQVLAEAIRGVVGGTVRSEYRSWYVTAADGRKWSIVPDGSLNGGDSNSGEVVSPILTYADLDTVQNIIRAVRAAGAKADTSTGIHIHVGAEHFSPKAVANLVKLVHKQERLIEHALGVDAQRLERYCRPIDQGFLRRLEAMRPQTKQELSTAWYGHANALPSRYDNSRYHGLNLNSYFFRGTIEFRYFNGTTHAGEVKAYLQFVLALCAKALTTKTASSKRREFNTASAKYDFRTFLLHLNLIGDEFKTARLHLMKKLAGSAAWKGARRDRRPAADAAPAADTSTSDGEEVGHAAAA